MGTTGMLRVRHWGLFTQEQGVTLRQCKFRLKLGSTTLIFTDEFIDIANSNTPATLEINAMVSNVDSQAVQTCSLYIIGALGSTPGLSTTVSGIFHGAATEDTSSAKTLALTVQLEVADADVKYEGLATIVELL
jgi:hypothetical protein